MTDSPRPDAVERSLREALFAKAEDMAPGDGAAWDPYRSRAKIVTLGAETEARRGPGWRTLAAAVAAIALPVAGGAFLLADRADPPELPADPVCAPDPTTTTTEDLGPPTTPEPTTTTAAASAASIQQGPTSTTPVAPDEFALLPGATTTTVALTTTTDPDPCALAEEECEQGPSALFVGDDPTQVQVGEAGWVEVWVAVNEGAADPAGIAPGSSGAPPSDPDAEIVTTVSGSRVLDVPVGDMLFVAEGVDISDAELRALAATVEPRTPGSVSYTPPCDAAPATPPTP